MPYVDPETRKNLDNGVPALLPGHLNYLVTKLAIQYIADRGLSYNTINDVLGALDGARQEFYRRVAAHYEDGKIDKHGDVYPDYKGTP